MKDDQIVALYWARDPRAISETKTCYESKLLRLAENILRDMRDSEECVNDTYLKAWQTIPPQRPIYLFAFLARICRNEALGRIDWRNAAKRKDQWIELSDELESCIPDKKQMDPADLAALTDVFDRFLAGLHREDRILFLRRYWYGDTVEELSVVLKLRQGTVKTRLFRLRKKLRSYLEQEGIEC